jgi:hypothetical protein
MPDLLQMASELLVESRMGQTGQIHAPLWIDIPNSSRGEQPFDHGHTRWFSEFHTGSGESQGVGADQILRKVGAERGQPRGHADQGSWKNTVDGSEQRR